MKSLLRRFRRHRRLAKLAGRRRELETELAAHFQHEVRLVAAAVKGGGGYDEIFHAHRGRERFAVVRLFSPFKEPDDPIGPHDLALPLAGKRRLEREWEAYQRLAPAGLSPAPLWRTHDAIVCAWLPWERGANLLKNRRMEFWRLFEPAVAAARRMHDLGVVHLDMNWGNLLAAPKGDSVAMIDFEFGPADWASPAQQEAYDYLRLIEDCLKPRRGNRALLADLPRLAQLLKTQVPAGARAAKLGFAFHKLERLAGHAELRAQLQRVFPHLND